MTHPQKKTCHLCHFFKVVSPKSYDNNVSPLRFHIDTFIATHFLSLSHDTSGGNQAAPFGIIGKPILHPLDFAFLNVIGLAPAFVNLFQFSARHIAVIFRLGGVLKELLEMNAVGLDHAHIVP